MTPGLGTYVGAVIENVDPENSGRVRVRFAEADGDAASQDVWARVATPAVSARGRVLRLDVGSEVLVVFDQSATPAPYVLGRVWSETDRPPEGAAADDARPIFRSRTGITLTIDDASGQQRVAVETPAGQKLTIDGVSGEIEILDAFGNTLRLAADGIVVQSSANIAIKTAASLQLTASAVSVDAGTVTCSGTIQCETLVAKSVVSASYSPGAGNIW